jgi:alkaline phosphatase D
MARTWNDALPEPVRKALVKIKLIDADGTGPDYDQWDGYPQERRQLIEAIGELDVQNVVVLSGDVHVGLAAELAEDPHMPPVAVEFVNTSITSQNLDDKMGWAPRTESLALEATLLGGMPHLRYIDLDSHGYSIVDVNRERVRFEWWNVAQLVGRVPGQTLAMSMSVNHGEPRLVSPAAAGEAAQAADGGGVAAGGPGRTRK